MNLTLQKNIFFLFLTLFALDSNAQSDGTLDAPFGAGGLVTEDNNGNTDDGNDLVLMPDKNIIVGGTTVGNGYDFSICSFTGTGALDNSFGNGGKLFMDIANGSDDYLTALALDSNQKIVAAGYSKTGADIYIVVIRISSSGVPDNTFGNNGVVMLNPTITNLAYDIAIQPDNKILVTGFVYDGLSPEKAVIIRLNEDGTYDGSFGDNGVWEGSPDPSFNVRALSMALQTDGKILIAGYHDVNDDDQMAVGRILSTGSMDVSFSTDGWVVKNLTSLTDDIAHSLTLQHDGKILIAGESNGEIAICRLNIDGTDDAGFAAGGSFIDPLDVNDDVLYSIIVQPDDHILAAGGGSINDNVDFLLLRLTPAGVLDNTFGSGGIVYTGFDPYNNDYVHSIALQPDLKIVAAGSTFLGYYTDVAVARYGNGATAVSELRNDPSVHVYPNPSDGNFNVELLNGEMNTSIEIKVTNPLGQIVFSSEEQMPGNVFTKAVSLFDMADGVYTIEMKSEMEVVNKKILIAK